MLKPMLRGEALSICIIPMEEPKNPIIKFTKYTKAIPPVAAKIPSLKFSVGFIIPDLYAVRRASRIPTVKKIAFVTIPS